MSQDINALSVCLELARAISQTRTVDEIYEAALDALGAVPGAARAAILLFDADGVMRFKAWRRLSPAYQAAVEGHTPWTPTSPNPDVIVVSDIRADAALAPFRAAIEAEGIAAMIFVPLVSSSRLIGKFMLYRDEPWTPSRDELAFASIIASQVAFAVERTRASQQLAALVESSGDAIVSKDLDGIITTWNPAAERLFGYTAAEAIGRPITLIIPNERLPEERLVLERIRAGQPVDMETIRQRKDGSSVPISLMVSPIRAADGRVVGASKVARDISVRRRDEAERAELHRRLALLVSASGRLLDSLEAKDVIAATLTLGRELLPADACAIWVNDLDGQVWRIAGSVGVSERFAARIVGDYTGPSPGSELFAGALAVEDVETHPLLTTQLRWYRDEGIQSMLVCPMRLGEGDIATLSFYLNTRRTFSEADTEAAETLANLAASSIARAQLHAQLRTERNDADAGRRRAAFLADATATLSESLEYEQTLAQVARRAVPEIADACFVELADESGALQLIASAHAAPGRASNASDPQEAIGSVAPNASMKVSIASPRGTLGAITFVQPPGGREYDTSDLVLAQELAARAALAIENAVAYRRANEASRVKDEFLATLSHELRTPLNAVLGYAQMLDRGVLGEERRQQSLTILLRNATALKQLIDDVLDVSRIGAGRLRLDAHAVNLSDAVTAAVATTQPAADAKGVRLEVLTAPDGAAVWGDPDRLQQIAWNLLSNAVKFTSRGGRVEVRIEVEDGAVQLTVDDDGQGIAPEFLPRIFERFTQADSHVSREHSGLGIGLAIVRELTELHGGLVSATSGGVGCGATFTVRFPLVEPGASDITDGRGQRAAS
jgi:PAS domain S-box-containing protein